MTIELPPDLAEKVQERIDGGQFSTPVDVVRDALEAQTESEIAWMTKAELRRAIALGTEQADRGQLTPADEVFRRLRERIRGSATP